MYAILVLLPYACDDLLRPCASAQSSQSLGCSHTDIGNIGEWSGLNLDLLIAPLDSCVCLF